jgi:P pilus assembly chaperone PapD
VSLVTPTFVVLSSLAPALARAQLSVDRIEIVIDAKSAAARTASFNVANKTRSAAQAVITVQDWDRDSTGENRFFPAGSTPGTCGKSLTVEPMGTRLEPGSSQEVRIAIDSAMLPAHECWAVVFVESAIPTVQQTGRRVTYVVRTGVKVYVVPAGAVPNGDVVDMRVRPHVRLAASDTARPRGMSDSLARRARLDSAAIARAAADTSRQELALAFTNTGARHVLVQGTLELRRPDNSVASKIAMPHLHVLPGATQHVAVPLPNLPRGRYVALAILDYGGSDVAAGQVEYEVP